MLLTSAFSNRQLSLTIANSSRTCALFYTLEKSTFAQTGQCASSFCQCCHALFDRHGHTKTCWTDVHNLLSANSLYKICKNVPVLSSSFCTMWAKQQNNQSISPRNNRTPSTFYNAGKYFESVNQYCHRYYWQDCFLPFNLAGVYCMYFTTPDLQGTY